MPQAIINLVQEKHCNLPNKSNTNISTTNTCGYVSAYYKIPLQPGYTVAIGRSPVIELADEVLYVPSNYVTRHIGYIRCVKTATEELLHILTVETSKLDFYNKHNEPLPRKYVLKDNDVIKFENLPIKMFYNLKWQNKIEKQHLQN